MILTDFCRCDNLKDKYGIVSTCYSAVLYAEGGVKLEPLEVKSEPLDCQTCHSSLYTHNTKEVQIIGGEVAVCPVPWLEYKPNQAMLVDKLSRSVKVGHLPSSIHQESLKGTLAMAGPVITLEYFHQTGQYMQYWFCEYQAEEDALTSVKKLHGTMCHGVELHITLALKNREDLGKWRDVAQSKKDVMMTQEQCLVCDAVYSSSEDLSMHLYISHNMFPLLDPFAVDKKHVKFSKIRKKIADEPEPFDPESWVENRPFRNEDYTESNQYTLDGVIGMKEVNGRIGFVPIDHTYADVGEVVRGMIPSSILNGPDPITFHPSMVTKVQQKEKIMYIPVEHSYSKMDPNLIWCSVCGRKYSSIEVLKEHLPVHFKKGDENRKRRLKRPPCSDENFTCKMCCEVFYTKKEFITHVASHEGDDELLQCKYCESIFTSSTKLNKHHKLHECSICMETFRCTVAAKNHQGTHTQARSCCEVCGKKFPILQDFIDHLSVEKHVVTKQARRTLVIPAECETFDSFEIKPRVGDFHCLKCSKTCQSDVELYSHMGFHHRIRQSKPELTSPKHSQLPLVTSPEPLVKSPTQTSRKASLKITLHVPKAISPPKKSLNDFDQMFTSTETFLCSICKKTLTSKKLLQIHMAAHKSQFLRDLKPEIIIAKKEKVEKKERTKSQGEVECPKCPGLTFADKDGLENHEKAFHFISEEEVSEPLVIPGLTPPVVLPVVLKSRLGKAKKSAVKLFKCVYCEKRFAHEVGLGQHIQAVHNLTQSGRDEKRRAPEIEADESDEKRLAPKTESDEQVMPVHNLKENGVEEDIVRPKVKKFKRTTPKTFLKSMCDGDRKDRDDDNEDRPKLRSDDKNSGVIRARKTAAKLFKCKICDIRFGSKRILSFHKQQHAEGKIKIPEQKVAEHENVKEVNTPKSNAGNNQANKSFDSTTESPTKNDREVTKDNLQDKLATDAEENAVYSDVNEDINKIRKFARKTIMKKVFECDICKELFLVRSEYIEHIKNHVDDEGSPVIDGEALDDVDDLDGEELVSDISDIENIQPNNNYGENFPLDPTLEELSDTENTLDTSLKVKTEETKTCNICSKKFLAWSTICAHIGTHEGATTQDVTVDWKEPFNPLLPCYICREKIHAIRHCYLHYKYHVNLNQGILQCTVCGIKYDKVGSLHTHMKVHVPRVAFEDHPQITDRTQEICNTCNRITTPKSRKRHIEIHLESIVHYCEICLSQFSNQREYIEHFHQQHYNINKTEVIKRHGLNDESNHLKCCYCKSLFLSVKSKRNHEYKHKKGIFKLPCSKCLLRFQDEASLKYHLQFGHDGEVYKLHDSDKKQVCAMCSKMFRSYKAKWYHEKVQHKQDVPYDPPLTEDDSLLDTADTPDMLPVSTFVSSDDKQSSDIVTSPMKLNLYSCLQCGNTFRLSTELSFHRQTVHGESAEESIICALSDHGESLEEGEICDDEGEICEADKETFYCSICQMRFEEYSEKWFHDKEVHGQERKCMACGLDFKTNEQLEDHNCMSVAKPEDGNDSLITYEDRKCHACNKLIPDKIAFKDHIKKHWFRCFSCHYDFCSKKSLRAHLKLRKCYCPDTTYIEILLDEVQSQCLLCDHIISINDHIKQHYLDHTVKENGRYEMFICTICGAPYKLQDQLREHMRTEAFFLVSKIYPKLKQIPLTGSQITTQQLLADNTEIVENTEDQIVDLPREIPSLDPPAQCQWACPYCNMTYNNYKSTWSHIRSFHKSAGKPIKVDEPISESEINGVKYESEVVISPPDPVQTPEYEPSKQFTSPSYLNHYEKYGGPNQDQEPPEASFDQDEIPTEKPAVSHRSPIIRGDSSSPPIQRAALFGPGQPLRHPLVAPPRSSLLPTPQRSAGLVSAHVPNRELYDPMKTEALIAKMLQGAREEKRGEVDGKRLRDDIDGTPLYTEKKARTDPQSYKFHQYNDPQQSYRGPRPQFNHLGQHPSGIPRKPLCQPMSRLPGVPRSPSGAPPNRLLGLPRSPSSVIPNCLPRQPCSPSGFVQNCHPRMPRSPSGLVPNRHPAPSRHPGPAPNRHTGPPLYRHPGPPRHSHRTQDPTNSYINDGPYLARAQHRPRIPINEHRLRFRPPSMDRARYPSAERPTIEHSTSENISCKSELSSRPNTSQKPISHKCSYCQRSFKNYFTVYNHLIRNHLCEVKCSGRQKPISSVVGRSNVWSFELSDQ